MPSWQVVLVPACQGHSLTTLIVLAPSFTAPPLTRLKSVLALTASPRATSLFGSALGMSCHVPCPPLSRAQPKPHQELRVPQPSPASVVLASPETRKWEQKTPLGIILVTGEFGKGSSTWLGIDDSQGLVETSNWMGAGKDKGRGLAMCGVKGIQVAEWTHGPGWGGTEHPGRARPGPQGARPGQEGRGHCETSHWDLSTCPYSPLPLTPESTSSTELLPGAPCV